MTKTKEEEEAYIQTTDEITKVALFTVGSASVLIGCWAVACLLSGMLSSGGPINLVTNLFKSITG